MKEFEYEDLKKATKDFSPSKIIGKGSHGCVYKGVLQDGQVVAIKKWSTGLQNLQDDSKLENEATILTSLPESTNLVSLLGTSRPDSAANSVALVMEFMPNGSLHDHLLHANSVLSWSRRVRIALQLAKSLQFLHGLKPKVVHRDVKSANVLFDKDWNAKLGDFGLALRLKSDGDDDHDRVDSVSRPAGTIGYLDPCYTTPCMLSPKIDVFSFGVVLLEIVSGQKVIDGSRSKTCIVDWALPLIKNRRFESIFDRRVTIEPLMEGTMRKLLGIAVRCVGENRNRPTMDEVVHEIENCYIERARFPIWVKFLREITILKIANRKRCRQETVLQHSSSTSTSTGKLLLKDVLADATYS